MSMNHPVRPGRGKGYVPLAWAVYVLVSTAMAASVLTGCKAGDGHREAPTPTVVRAPAKDTCRCIVRPTLTPEGGRG